MSLQLDVGFELAACPAFLLNHNKPLLGFALAGPFEYYFLKIEPADLSDKLTAVFDGLTLPLGLD